MKKIIKYSFCLLFASVLFFSANSIALSSQLDKEIATIEKLRKDGVLSDEDFEKVKKNLIEKNKKRQAKLKTTKSKEKKIFV